MSQLSLNNKYIAEVLSPEQRKKAQEILDKETGADKKKADAEAAKERAERRKDKELELKAANLKIRQDREARRSKSDEQRKAARKKAETVKKAQEYGDKAKTALNVKKEVISDTDGDGTALGKLGSNVGRTAAGVGKAIYNKVKERQEKKKIKEETSMKNVPIKDRKVIKERGKNLFKKDLTGSVMNANESANPSDNKDVKAQQKREDMAKKRVLMAKLRAVRSGSGESITASYNPELVVISEVDGDTKKEKLDKIIDVMRGKNKVEVNPKLKAEGYTVNEHHTKDADGKVIEHEDEAPGTPSSVEEGVIDMVKKGAKRHSKAIEKKKIKNRKAVPYAALGASYQPEGEVLDERLGGKGYKPYTSLTGKKVSGDWEDSDRGAGNKAKKRAGGKVEKKSPTYLAHVHNKEERVFEGEVIDEKKKGLDGKECWDGYKLAGTKKKGGKTVDNCVKVKEDYYSGTGEKVQKRTLAWMKKKGQKGAPGLDAMKAREAEHKARRGVKNEDVTLQDVDGKDRVEIIDIIKPEPMKSPKNNIMWNEEKMTKVISSVREKKRKNALQIQKVIGT